MSHNTILRTCANCGNSFKTNAALLRQGYGKFCSRSCYHSQRTTTFVTKNCKSCRELFSVELGQYNSRVKRGHTPTYCSAKCRENDFEYAERRALSVKDAKRNPIATQKAIETKRLPLFREAARQRAKSQWNDPEKRAALESGIAMRSQSQSWISHNFFKKGTEHPFYKGNATSHKREFNYEYKQWRKKVFQRDNYTCQECKKLRVKLNAHHIKPWITHPELRYSIDNGKSLCETCHAKQHGKTHHPKTYKCVICGVPKTDGRSLHCRSCGGKTRRSIP